MNDNWRERLPRASDRRIALRLTPGALREIRSGTPWVFDRSVTSVSDTGAPGNLAVIFDDKRRFAAIGLWDPNSPVRVKVLHTGDPTTIDADWWRGTLRAAIDRRESLAADDSTTAYRCVNGETTGCRRWSSTATTRRWSSSCTALLGFRISRRSSMRWSTSSRPSGSCCGWGARSRRATHSVSPTVPRSWGSRRSGPCCFGSAG